MDMNMVMIVAALGCAIVATIVMIVDMRIMRQTERLNAETMAKVIAAEKSCRDAETKCYYARRECEDAAYSAKMLEFVASRKADAELAENAVEG